MKSTYKYQQIYRILTYIFWSFSGLFFLVAAFYIILFYFTSLKETAKLSQLFLILFFLLSSGIAGGFGCHFHQIHCRVSNQLEPLRKGTKENSIKRQLKNR